MTVENLSDAASASTEGRVRGSRLPHTPIAFQFDGAPRSFNLDDWINRRSSAAPHRQAINAGTIPAADARRFLENWTCDASFFDELVRSVFLKTASSASFCEPDAGAGVTFAFYEGMTPATEHQKNAFVLLATGAAAMHWREKTGAALNLTSVKLNHNGQSSTIKLTWNVLLRRLRKTIQSYAKRATAPFNYDDAGRTQFDLMIYEEIEGLSGGFRNLRGSNILHREPHGNGFVLQHTASSYLGDSPDISGGKEDDIKKVLNHLRFIIYAEWRIAYEIINQAA